MGVFRRVFGINDADSLDGTDWAAPAAIGSATPAAGTFTTLTANTSITVNASANALIVGTDDADTWASFAARAFVGYDTPNGALLQADTNGPTQLRGGHATFGSGTLGVHVAAVTGNVGLCGATTFGTNAARVISITNSSVVAPTTSPADHVQLWCEDINAGAGYASLHMRNEIYAGAMIVPGVVYKTDTGNPANPFEGLIEINTFDNRVNIYAEGAWRQLAAW